MNMMSWRLALLLLGIVAFLPGHAQSQALLGNSLNGSYGFRFPPPLFPAATLS